MDDPNVTLREVTPEDVAVFYEHQRDDESSRMAAFPARDRAAHAAHWRKILADETVVTRTVLLGSRVAGNVVSWDDGTHRLVGYWIDRRYWGRGIATAALAHLLELVPERPLHAHVAAHNAGSIRVLEKCGFRRTGAGEAHDGFVDVLMELGG
ncbi:MAG: GNAT family N-acetyltransferase [Actinomycetota bacterium]|nr:GNAT family N-acetyltransferase [Actinomycetota bacterium]